MNWIDYILIRILFRRRARNILLATELPTYITQAEADNIAEIAIAEVEAEIAAQTP